MVDNSKTCPFINLPCKGYNCCMFSEFDRECMFKIMPREVRSRNRDIEDIKKVLTGPSSMTVAILDEWRK